MSSANRYKRLLLGYKGKIPSFPNKNLDPGNKINSTSPIEPNTTIDTGTHTTARILEETVDTKDKIILKPDDIVAIRVADTTKKDLNLSDVNQLSAYFEFTGMATALMMDSNMRFFPEYSSSISKIFS